MAGGSARAFPAPCVSGVRGSRGGERRRDEGQAVVEGVVEEEAVVLAVAGLQGSRASAFSRDASCMTAATPAAAQAASGERQTARPDRPIFGYRFASA